MRGPYATTWREYERAASRRVRLREGVRRRVLDVLARRAGTPPPGLRIVHYHYVFDDQRDGFARQLEYVRANFEPVGLSEGIARLREGRLSGRELVVTFDDGFANWMTNAVPRLAEQGISACFFVTTDLIDPSFETLARICRDKLLMPFPAEPLSWEAVRQLVSLGHEVGSHTCTHTNLVGLARAAVEDELRSSRNELARRLGTPPAHFSAPYGNRERFSPAVSDAARAVGYESCASAERGINTSAADVFALRRDHLIASWPVDHVRYFLSRS